MDVKSLKMPGALTAWAVARLSTLKRKYTIQNRINGSEGGCVCVCAPLLALVCLRLFMCAAPLELTNTLVRKQNSVAIRTHF